MKRNLFKFAAMILVVAGGLNSCRENGKNADEDCSSIFNIVHDESASIIGKWKFVKGRTSFYNVTCNDYSSYNIVYEFKVNNILTISAKTETPEIWPKTGEYVYSIIEDGDKSGRNLKIDNNYYWHRISSGSKELIIDLAPLDGPIKYLIKIQ